jgi:hypothetical protein
MDSEGDGDPGDGEAGGDTAAETVEGGGRLLRGGSAET